MEEKPAVKATILATKAEEFLAKGNVNESMNCHYKAAELFLEAMRDTKDPEVRKTLKILSSHHIQKAQELAKKPQQQQQEEKVEKIQESIHEIKIAEEYSDDPFDHFWNVVEGLVEKLPVAFTSTPLTRPVSKEDSFYIVNPIEHQIIQSYDFGDIESSFFKPTRKKSMEELEEENKALKKTVESLNRKLICYEKAAEENVLLKSSIMQFKNEIQKTGIQLRGNAESMIASKYSKQEVSSIKRLQSENAQLLEENQRQRREIKEFKEKWEQLKESARKKKAQSSSSSRESINFDFD